MTSDYFSLFLPAKHGETIHSTKNILSTMKQKSLHNILVRVCKDSRFHSSPGFITSPYRLDTNVIISLLQNLDTCWDYCSRSRSWTWWDSATAHMIGGCCENTPSSPNVFLCWITTRIIKTCLRITTNITPSSCCTVAGVLTVPVKV